MKNKVNLYIPKACPENWEKMQNAERGRFCSTCSKNVYDFTNSSDREIVIAFNHTNNLCGRFRPEQLNRDLLLQKEKKPIPIIAAAVVLSFLGIGSHEMHSQKKHEIVQTLKTQDTIPLPVIEDHRYKGIVTEYGLPLPGVIVAVKNSDSTTQTDFDGKFSIIAKEGSTLVFSLVGSLTTEYTTLNDSLIKIDLLPDPSLETKVYYVGGIKNRTFFGHIFYSIGNLFRKK